MKQKNDGDDKLISDILMAEESVEKGVEKAEAEAKKIMEKAMVVKEGLRDKSVVKLKNETKKLTDEFEQQRHEQQLMMQEDAKAEINKITKNTGVKMDEIATQIVKEILAECQ